MGFGFGFGLCSRDASGKAYHLKACGHVIEVAATENVNLFLRTRS